MKRPSRIVITGDVFRVDDRGQYSQALNIRWLWSLLRRKIFEATGLEPELLGPVEAKGCDAYERTGVELSENGWARLYDHLPDEDAAEFIKKIDDAFCISFELPPLLKTALTAADIPYLDIILHPVRFLDDLMFGMETNSPEISQPLSQAALHENRVHDASGVIRAFVSRTFLFDLDAFTLFAAQAPVDRSLIKNGKIATLSDFSDRLKHILGPRNRIFFRHHPYVKNINAQAEVERCNPQTFITERNIYQLLSCPKIESVAAINSSVLTEAKYFDVRSDRLMPADYEVKYAGDSSRAGYWTVHRDFLSADFWRKILRPVMATTAMENWDYLGNVGVVRRTLNMEWGYDSTFSHPIAPVINEPRINKPQRPLVVFSKLFRKTH